MAAWTGGEFGGEWIHIYVWLSPFVVHLNYCKIVNQSVNQHHLESVSVYIHTCVCVYMYIYKYLYISVYIYICIYIYLYISEFIYNTNICIYKYTYTHIIFFISYHLRVILVPVPER